MDIKFKFRQAVRSAVRGLREFAYSCPLPDRYRRSFAPRPRLGLALGGGFARGLAHVGVLKVLAENHIPIDVLAGTSVGSVVAAAFASGCPLDEMIKEAQEIRWKSFARWTLPRLGFATNERMEAALRRVLRCSRFEELIIPMVVVAADISTGETVAFRRGELIPPLRASCSFPGLFAPVEVDGRLLVDGAIVASVPVDPLREIGVESIVAVNLRINGPHHVPTNIFQVVGQAFQIAQSLNQITWREHCALVIEPDVRDFKWDDFERADDLILAGELAARHALPSLRAMLESRRAMVSPPVPAR